MGDGAEATGGWSIALGARTEANRSSGNYGVAIGNSARADGDGSVAIGNSVRATYSQSIAIGKNAQSSGYAAIAMGYYTLANCFGQTTVGQYSDNTSFTNCNTGWTIGPNNGAPLFVVGNGTADNARSNAFWVYDNGTAVFQGSVYADNGSTLLGAGANYDNVTSNGFYSNSTNAASGDYSTAFGSGSVASGNYSFAAGRDTTANDEYATALGYETEAGFRALASGWRSYATGHYSTAIGRQNEASGTGSISMGFQNGATATASVALGYETDANCYAQTTIGQFSDNTSFGCTPTSVAADGSPLFVIGNGTGDLARSNAFVVYDNGTTTIDGDVIIGTNGGGSKALVIGLTQK